MIASKVTSDYRAIWFSTVDFAAKQRGANGGAGFYRFPARARTKANDVSPGHALTLQLLATSRELSVFPAEGRGHLPSQTLKLRTDGQQLEVIFTLNNPR